MIADLLGITALLSVAFWVLMCARHWPSVASALWAAFALRAGAALFNFYVARLPGSGADDVRFERIAWEWAQGGFGEALGHFTGPSSYFMSWIIALLYALTDRSLLLAQSVSVLMGTGTVLLGWLLVRELWGERVAMKASWVLVLFPTLVMYSALVMREAYIWFFLVLGFLGAARWARNGSLKPFLLAVFGFMGATFFHGAMFVGFLVFAWIVLWRSLKQSLIGWMRAKVYVTAIMAIFLTLVPMGMFSSGALSVPKLGDVSELADVDRLLAEMVISRRSSDGLEDGAAYPNWTIPNATSEFFYKSPVRTAYFMFAPFPWDVREIAHLFGVFDGVLYLVLAGLAWRHRKAIWADPSARIVVLIVLVYVFVFGFAVGNFGTGIRHRAKFVVMLIALAAPLLPRIRLRFKRNERISDVTSN